MSATLSVPMPTFMSATMSATFSTSMSTTPVTTSSHHHVSYFIGNLVNLHVQWTLSITMSATSLATLSTSMSTTPITTYSIVSTCIINRQSHISKVFRRYLHSPHIRNVGCKHQRLLSVSQSHTLLRTQKRYHDHDLVDGAHNPNDLKAFPKHDQDLPVSQYFHQISRLALQLASATTQRTTRPTCTTPSASSTSASVCLTLAPMDA